MHTVISQENSCVTLALLATSYRFAIAQVQQFKERVTECTRNRTLASRAHEQIPETSRIASLSAFNCTGQSCDKLFTSRAPLPCNKLLSTSARALTPTVLPDWQHLHCAAIAQSCEAGTRIRCDVWSCTPLNLAPLYIKCSPQQLPSLSHCHASSKFIVATRKLFSKR